MNKAFKITKNVISTIIIALLLLWLFFSIKSFIKKEPFKIFGNGYALVVSGSMEPEIHVGSFIWIKEKPFDDLKVGDDIVFKSKTRDIVIVHRIIKTEGGIITQGINNQSDDSKTESTITEQDYLGTVTATGLTWLGKILLDSRSSLILVIMLLLLILIVTQIVSLVKQLKQKQEEETKQKLLEYQESLRDENTDIDTTSNK